MASWEAIADEFWKALALLSVDATRVEADKGFGLALIGAPGSGKTVLSSTLVGMPPGQDVPAGLEARLSEYRLPLSVEDINALESATLLILLLDATKGDYVQEVAAADYLSYLGRPMLVCYSKMDLVPLETRLIHGQARWRGAEIMPLAATQPHTVEELLVPAVLDVLPEYALALARYLPLFRNVVADRLIERAARVNATYASASGLSETVPLLRLPLSGEDIEVLSANQATLAYRLGLAHGLSFDWRSDVVALRSAVDVGRLWRQLARRVVGVVPLWGLNSKVGLAYGGTVVTGRAMGMWFDSGQAPSSATVRELCREVAAQSRNTIEDLVAKARDAWPTPPPKPVRASGLGVRLPRLRLPRRRPKQSCTTCGRAVPSGAAFCAHCGTALEGEDESSVAQNAEK
jgi:uncharacterized protein (DUF697 family)